jgi:hypothetical protein
LRFANLKQYTHTGISPQVYDELSGICVFADRHEVHRTQSRFG